ncbi:hypothetical protein [Halobacillus sp. A5]|uniref:hypothetical protein n=1 Tax=Halobacillus sp. A5 TaxID=2880263 RepID=UPI0020A65960|nr:hypothetical protein [Halobacillus sp. A5]MCP3027120.1 hypothetical protein [Halobacillus sp. A5]
MKLKLIGVLFVVIVAASVTNPDSEDFKEWLLDEKEMNCLDDRCTDEHDSTLEHFAAFRDSLIISSARQTVYYPEGEEETIRAVGVFSHFFEVEEENWLWQLLH